MSLTSKRLKRYEKEAILRSKEFGFKREQSEHLLAGLPKYSEQEKNSCSEESEQNHNDRWRRQITTRRIRQIHRDADYELGLIERLNERAHYELRKQQISTKSAFTNSKHDESLHSTSKSDEKLRKYNK